MYSHKIGIFTLRKISEVYYITLIILTQIISADVIEQVCVVKRQLSYVIVEKSSSLLIKLCYAI